MIRKNSLKTRNRLWQARKRARLGQKQIASLLRHRTSDQVSRYERGERLPTLKTALRLEIILGLPLRHLYADLHKSLRAEIEHEVQGNPSLSRAFTQASSGERDFGEFCSHEDRSLLAELSPEEAEAVRRHVTRLARRLASR